MKKFIKNITGILSTTWGILVFITFMMIFYLPMWISGLWPEPKRTKYLMDTIRVWMRIFFGLTGIQLTVRGRANFQKDQNYIVVCNHNSLMDVPLSSPFIPGANKTIAKIEMSTIPLFGMIYKRGAILVDRKSDASRKDSFSKMQQVLELGMHMCIYPEGTRNKSGQPLKDFQSGAFRLALATGKPIIPAVIFNTGKVLPSSPPYFFRPHAVGIHFLDPITIEPDQSAEELKKKIHQIMWDYIESRKDENGTYRL